MSLKLEKLPNRYLGYLEQFTMFLVLTVEGFQALVDFDASKTAVRKVLKRLRYAGWIVEISIPHGGPGYMLSPRAMRAIDLPRRKNKGVSQSGVIQHLGLLYACVRGDIDKLSAGALFSSQPHLACNGIPSGNYGIAADNRLVWIHVSHGGLPHRLAAKAAEIVRKRKAVRGFRDLIKSDRFGVIVAVPSVEVATEFNIALVSQKIDPQVSVRPVVVPELSPLLLAKHRVAPKLTPSPFNWSNHAR